MARKLTPIGLAFLLVWTTGLVLLNASALGAEPVTIGAESSGGVGSSSATLHAQVNPGGRDATDRFEYGISTSYGAQTPGVSLGQAHELVGATAQLSALQPETTYHFRVVISYEGGQTSAGADATFTTLPTGLLGLPDGRGYEMVSPVDDADGDVYEPIVLRGGNNPEGDRTERPFQAAADGHALVYTGAPSATGGTGNVGSGIGGNAYLATRGPSGWSAANIEPASGSLDQQSLYEAFSSDLSQGILTADETQPLAAGGLGGRYSGLYARDFADGTYQSLLDTTPPNRGHGEFDSYEVFQASENAVVYAGTNTGADGVAAFSHVLFEANDALTADAVDGGATVNNLYDSEDGRLRLVNVLPDGTSEANATFGAPVERGAVVSQNPADYAHVISADGRRIFWSALDSEGQPKALYVRENDAEPQSPLNSRGECTVASDACTVLISEDGRFWTASADGSKVFFTDGDLYEYDVNTAQTVDLTPAGGEVQGVLGASEDGAYVYFAAKGVLAAGASPQICAQEFNVQSECNVYLFHEGQPLTFVAALAGTDNPPANVTGSTSPGDWKPGAGIREAAVTPDGLHLAFRSSLNLTGEARGVGNLYLYDAEAAHLACVSCSGSVGGEAQVPLSYSNTYVQRWLLDDGSRVFFDSTAALVPADKNGQLDVYEWEREGTGGCGEKAPARLSGGCVYLLSGGASDSSSFFVDASASGDDAFVLTRAPLVAEDGNENLDVYDARVGVTQPPSTPQCSGAGCQGVPPVPPVFATPASETFTGVGNFPALTRPTGTPKAKAKSLTRPQKLAKALRACRRERSGRRRAKCEVTARNRYGAKVKAKQINRRGK
jgi:hypothetical protein